MGVLGSRLDPASDAHVANRAANLELLAELDRLLEQARAGGGQKYVDRHRARGKLLARERVELLLDRDGPFLELSPLAAWGTDFPVGASGVTGVGPVAGVECVVTASDPTVRGGATNPFGLQQDPAGHGDRRAQPAPPGPADRVQRGRPAHPVADLHPRRGGVPQPDPAVAGRHPHRGPGVRLVHRGRGLRPGPVRPHHHGQGAGQGVPGRPPAGPDGHRRAGHRRGAGRGRDARRRLRPGRPAGRPTSTTASGSAAR